MGLGCHILDSYQSAPSFGRRTIRPFPRIGGLIPVYLWPYCDLLPKEEGIKGRR
jgi:hypothetical protein